MCRSFVERFFIEKNEVDKQFLVAEFNFKQNILSKERTVECSIVKSQNVNLLSSFIPYPRELINFSIADATLKLIENFVCPVMEL